MGKKPLIVGWTVFPPLVEIKDGVLGGILIERTRELLTESGLKWQDEVLPYRRLLKKYSDHQVDFMIHPASSAIEHGYLVSTQPFLVVKGGLWSLRPVGETPQTESIFPPKVSRCVAVIQGYSIDEESKIAAKDLVTVSDNEAALKMLLFGRCDYMLGYEIPIEAIIQDYKQKGRYKSELERLSYQQVFSKDLHLTINPSLPDAKGSLRKLEATMLKMQSSSKAKRH